MLILSKQKLPVSCRFIYLIAAHPFPFWSPNSRFAVSLLVTWESTCCIVLFCFVFRTNAPFHHVTGRLPDWLTDYQFWAKKITNPRWYFEPVLYDNVNCVSSMEKMTTLEMQQLCVLTLSKAVVEETEENLWPWIPHCQSPYPVTEGCYCWNQWVHWGVKGAKGRMEQEEFLLPRRL